MRLALTVAAVALSVAACSSSPSKPDDTVKPISHANLRMVASALCLEPTEKIIAVLSNVGDASNDRMLATMDALADVCPERLRDVSQLLDAVAPK